MGFDNIYIMNVIMNILSGLTKAKDQTWLKFIWFSVENAILKLFLH